MNANPILLQKKYSRVIEQFARLQDISLDAALDFFLQLRGLSVDAGWRFGYALYERRISGGGAENGI